MIISTIINGQTFISQQLDLEFERDDKTSLLETIANTFATSCGSIEIPLATGSTLILPPSIQSSIFFVVEE